MDIPRMFREVDFEFRGVSTGKYSELSVGPRIYLLGGATEIMPDLAPGMHVSKVDHHSLLGSVGLGLATHSTTTTEFDLPTLVGSVLVYGRINYVFAVSERWGVGTVVSASLNITANYMSLAYFLSVGPRYKF